MRKLALTFLFPLATFAAIIDSARLPSDTAWQTAGVPGGIPTRSTIFQTLNSGSTESQIQTAINNCTSGQVVKLGAGTFTISTGLILKANTTLRGSGVGTVLQYTGTAAFNVVSTPDGGNASKVTITSSPTKGATSFTTGSTTGISTGVYLAITQTNPSFVTARSYGNSANIATWLSNDSGGTANMAQVVKVTSVSGGTVNFSPALYLDMTSSPKYQIMTMSTGIGLEDLVVARTQTTGDGCNVYYHHTAESWVKRVVIKWPQAKGILIQNSFGDTVENCALDLTNFSINHDSGRSYAIYTFDYGSSHLYLNNVVMGARHALVFEGGGSGCVLAYNTSNMPRNDNGPADGALITEDSDTHGAHPYMNLWEGNVVSRIVHDNTWGSSSHNLNFRTWSRGYTEAYTDDLHIFGRVGYWTAGDNAYNSAVGCVLMRPGDDTKDYGPDNYHSRSYAIGQIDPNDENGAHDSTVIATTYIHGTYSYKEATTTWDGSNADHTIPNSMFLSAQPSWWDAGQWPGNGPDLATKNGANPAYRRYAAYVAGGSSDYSLLITNASGGGGGGSSSITATTATVTNVTFP